MCVLERGKLNEKNEKQTTQVGGALLWIGGGRGDHLDLHKV